MIKHCEIHYNGEKIGTATIKKEGLYYSFQCLCRFDDKKIHRLTAYGETGIVDLGICVPFGNDFAVNTKVAASKLGKGEISIEADRRPEQHKECVPVDAGQPFPKLEELDTAILSESGIIFTEKAPDPQDSGQNP